MDSHAIEFILGHATPAALAIMACIYLAKENKRKDQDIRMMMDRYIAKHERVAEMQQETLRMQSQATLAVREATAAIAELREEIEGDK